MDIKELLEEVKSGSLTIDEARFSLKGFPYKDLGYAKIDLHRQVRTGAGEVIYGGGKSPEQINGIITAMAENGQNNILITHLSAEKADGITTTLPWHYYPEGELAVIGGMPRPNGHGTILVISAGTSDLKVTEEAALTAQFLGNKVLRLNDVGVAGLHRLLAHFSELQEAAVIIVVAGMDGALASVVTGLVAAPVIAVPTSIGYGASFGGLSALLAMLNSCAAGVATVNIDNGFGAAMMASRINHLEVKK